MEAAGGGRRTAWGAELAAVMGRRVTQTDFNWAGQVGEQNKGYWRCKHCGVTLILTFPDADRVAHDLDYLQMKAHVAEHVKCKPRPP